MHHDLVIHEAQAARIDGILAGFLAESSAKEALLIDRSGQLLASGGAASSFDTVSIGALAAGAFSSTSAIAELLGETEFSVLFHQGARESIHVSTVDDHTILLAIFDDRTTVGMVRLFAKEASRASQAALAEGRRQPQRVGALSTPLSMDEVRAATVREAAI